MKMVCLRLESLNFSFPVKSLIFLPIFFQAGENLFFPSLFCQTLCPAPQRVAGVPQGGGEAPHAAALVADGIADTTDWLRVALGIMSQ